MTKTESNKHLLRAVCDFLFDNQLLGVLLSPQHFLQTLESLHREPPKPIFTKLGGFLSDFVRLCDFHQEMILFCAGFHIDEVNHVSIDNLSRHLNEIVAKAFPGHTQSKRPAPVSEAVKMQIRYRVASSRGGTVRMSSPWL